MDDGRGIQPKRKQLENIEYSLGTFNNSPSKAYIMVTTIHEFYCIHLVPKVLVILFREQRKVEISSFWGFEEIACRVGYCQSSNLSLYNEMMIIINCKKHTKIQHNLLRVKENVNVLYKNIFF